MRGKVFTKNIEPVALIARANLGQPFSRKILPEHPLRGIVCLYVVQVHWTVVFVKR